MNLETIASLRLDNQKVAIPENASPREMVSWLGAVQAQDFPASKLALGIRLQNHTEQSINEAINKGEIVRTHILRPTWHLVAAEDIHWMLGLSAPKLKASLKWRHKRLEIDDKMISKSNDIIQKSLTDVKYLSREQLMEHLSKAGFILDNNRASHFLICAELDGIICNGIVKANRQTYALLDKWVPIKRLLSYEESLALLVKKYFQSRGPATLQDFLWWSGLTVSEAKRGIEMNKDSLQSETIENSTYWYSSITEQTQLLDSVFFIPAFDELVISYKDRTAFFSETMGKRAISVNGIFRPVIVYQGRMVGLWKKTINKDSLIVETDFFSSEMPSSEKIETALKKLEVFYEKKVVFKK